MIVFSLLFLITKFKVMKKIVFSIISFFVFCVMTFAESSFCVKHKNGNIVRYNLEEVDSVSFKEIGRNGFEYVDLGLPSGLLWAKCNVGASNFYDYGDYFAWGEIKPKKEYSTTNYTHYGKLIGNLKSEGVLDSKCTLTSSYDAATQNLGEGWRIPTDVEFQELVDNCTFTWTTINNVPGCKVESNKEGNNNWIFLPAAGYKKFDYSDNRDKYGYYMISNEESDRNLKYNTCVGYEISPTSGCCSNAFTTQYGHSVRPVISK